MPDQHLVEHKTEWGPINGAIQFMLLRVRAKMLPAGVHHPLSNCTSMGA